VRSAKKPWGLPKLFKKQRILVSEANKLAKAIDALAWRAHCELGADITLENPDPSFIWNLGLYVWPGSTDARFSPCMVGDDIAKPTKVRSWGIKLNSLKPVCAWLPSKQAFKCGRTANRPHRHLSSNKPGEPRMETWQAATYQPGTVVAWAADIRRRSIEVLQGGSSVDARVLGQLAIMDIPTVGVVEGHMVGCSDQCLSSRYLGDVGNVGGDSQAVPLSGTLSPGQGSVGLEPPRRIQRNKSRGVDEDSRKEIRDAEDAACNAGMRNPAAVCSRWPELVEAMQPVRQALLVAIAQCPDLQSLPLAVGKSPVREPPA
jgi:hypothetical protein